MADRHVIDTVLRDVPVPDGIEERLTPESLFEDAALDRLLQRVSVPAGIAGRIRTAVFAPGRGVDLDRAAVIQAAARAPVAEPRRGRGPVTIPAIAISLAAVAGLVFLVIGSGRPLHPGPDGPAIVLTPAATPRTTAPGDVPIGMLADDTPPSLEPADPLPASIDAVGGPNEDVAVLPPESGDTPRSKPQTVLGASVGAGADVSGDPGGMRIIGAARTEPRRRVPRIGGFDLAFEMAHGEMPFVDPRTVGLGVDQPPLAAHTGSCDALLLARGRRVRGAPSAWRTEDLLAALPAPAVARSAGGGPQLVIHAVQSLRGRPESCLVEIAAVAPPLARPAGGTIDAVLVLAHDAAREPLVWSWLCRSVEAVADQMRDGDRISVVIGGSQPRVAGGRLDAAAVRRLAVGLAATPPMGTVDLDATMRVATAEVAGTSRPIVVVAHAEAVDQARAEGRAAVTAWREALVRSVVDAPRKAAVRFVLVDPAEPTAREPSEPGFGRTPAEPREISRAVVERVFGISTLAVRQCRLEVHFDPKLVAAYRLVGHRQSAIESLTESTPPAIDLHAGESARAVYEVVMPRGTEGTALTARLSCQIDGGGSRVVTSTLPLRAVEQVPLPSPHGCELVLAVGVGELASGSPHALPRGPMAQSLAELAAAWRARGDVTALGAALIEAGSGAGIFKAAKPPPGPRS